MLWALAITAAFMLARALVNRLLPPAAGLDVWFANDAIKTAPRLAAVAVCLWAMRPRGVREYGSAAPAAAGAALAACVALAHSLRFVARASDDFSLTAKLLGALLTVPVAAWEELCYRGLLFVGLKRTMGPLAAAAASTTIFTLMHWGAIPVEGWPVVFLTGFALCGAAELGAGLGALMGAHWFIDSAWYWGPASPGGAPAERLSSALMIVVAVWSARALSARRASAPSPTLPG